MNFMFRIKDSEDDAMQNWAYYLEDDKYLVSSGGGEQKNRRHDGTSHVVVARRPRGRGHVHVLFGLSTSSGSDDAGHGGSRTSWNNEKTDGSGTRFLDLWAGERAGGRLACGPI